jgi:hypothetical protein
MDSMVSGWAPAAISIEKVKERIVATKTRMPIYGWIANYGARSTKAGAESSHDLESSLL